ncbi:hypothetical protein C2845_PM03G19250 [Panicum miliaceum]|uniref:DUF3615 domain-containing protein n=1 Tax=Panicum miliaceum TaxID=4540 RepID=A0A3L6T9T0_PANMI|nr:hypothetical protein C2845_PM03G19250 [Panicum miliaceum]
MENVGRCRPVPRQRDSRRCRIRVMEVLQLTTWRPKDLGTSPHHPGEPGWLLLLHSSLPQSNSSSECGALEGRPPSLSALLQLSGNSCSVDLVNAYFNGALPPPAPAREVDSNTKNRHVLFASPKGIHDQSMKYAKGALENYNKRKKPRVVLADSPAHPEAAAWAPTSPVRILARAARSAARRTSRALWRLTGCSLGTDVARPDSCARSALCRTTDVAGPMAPHVLAPVHDTCNFYTHVNFTAKSSKQGSQEQSFFFAELQLCSRRRASSGFLVTCCEPLGPDYTVGHKGLQLDGSAVRKNIDFTRCFACSPRILHPKVENYIAGHCNIPCIYDSPY